MDPGLEARLTQVEESLSQVESELASPEALASGETLAGHGSESPHASPDAT